MNHSDIIIISIAGLLQLSVAAYALRLTHLFGVARVGWSLFCAFALLALVHLIQATDLFTSNLESGTKIEVIYAFISFLLLLGLAHIETVFKDRRRMEQQVQKMESIGQLAGGIAHDFNNILTVIQGYVSLLTAKQHDPETTGELNQIAAAASRAASLTRQLLMFVKRHSMQTESLDLNTVINNLSQMLCRLIGENIVLNNTCAASLPLIRGNVGMIEEIIVNLAVNARDAMPKGGTLSISTTAVKVDEAHVAGHPGARKGEFVCIRISDTGTGMTPAVLSRIFEPFFTTKGLDKGTGLGLVTVQRIAQQHSGWVEVQSQVGVGTEFKVYFPCAPQPEIKKPTEAGSTPSASNAGTILLVEDEEPVRHLAARLLKRNGYQVMEADCGIKALEIWKEQAPQIDLLVTDMIMPGGVSGHELADYLLKLKPDLKVVYTSGYSPDAMNQATKSTERLRFVPKPYTPETLLQAIQACLAIRTGDSARSSQPQTGDEPLDRP